MGTPENIARFDYRDLVIEDACAELVLKDERIASLEADNRTYHDLAVQGIEALREKTHELRSLKRQYADLREEFRQFRVRILSADMADAHDTTTLASDALHLDHEGAPCH